MTTTRVPLLLERFPPRFIHLTPKGRITVIDHAIMMHYSAISLYEAFTDDVAEDLRTTIGDLSRNGLVPTEQTWPIGIGVYLRRRHTEEHHIVIRLPNGQELRSEPAEKDLCLQTIQQYHQDGIKLVWEIILTVHGTVTLRLHEVMLPSQKIGWPIHAMITLCSALQAIWKIPAERHLDRLREPLAYVLPRASPQGILGFPWHKMGYVEEVRAWRDAMGVACLSSLKKNPP